MDKFRTLTVVALLTVVKEAKQVAQCGHCFCSACFGLFERLVFDRGEYGIISRLVSCNFIQDKKMWIVFFPVVLCVISRFAFS